VVATGPWLVAAGAAAGAADAGAALALPWLRRRYRHQPLSRLTLREFELIREAHADGQSAQATVSQVARLLRRVLISYRGRERHAASTGEDWLAELEQLAPRHGFSDDQLRLLTRDRYRAQLDGDVDGLLQACEKWIRNLPRERNHVSA
jgi:DNA-binding PucR family transcriptional regulator